MQLRTRKTGRFLDFGQKEWGLSNLWKTGREWERKRRQQGRSLKERGEKAVERARGDINDDAVDRMAENPHRGSEGKR